jgi:hypothetical protein
MPTGSLRVTHEPLAIVLGDLLEGGILTLRDNAGILTEYRAALGAVSPDTLAPAEALAFWVNLYNAGALLSAERAIADGASSVLRVPGAFSKRDLVVDGEAVSLDDIEHGKIRRFGDPRIHAALVCGSVSCPTLRGEPFSGDHIDRQLDHQMRTFVASGGARVDRSHNVVELSSIFLWYGRDFTRPDRMPSLRPEHPGRVRDAVAWWMDEDDRAHVWRHRPEVAFMSYDWGLACAVSPAP